MFARNGAAWSLVYVLVATACATNWGVSPRQSAFIDSTPLGASVIVDRKPECVTLCTIKLSKRRSHTITVTDSTGVRGIYKIRRHPVSKWVLADLTFGLGIGLIVDYSNGRLFKLAPTDIVVAADSTGGK